MRRWVALAGSCLVLCWASAQAAPLDALLSASQGENPGQLQLTLSYDLVNDTVDILKLRSSDSNYAGTNVGDYHGMHLRAAWDVSRDFRLDGGLWARRIDYRQDTASISSWQVAGQYRLHEGNSLWPSLALRVGAWGNLASELKKSSPTTASGITLDTVTVASPRDLQLQADLIGTVHLSDSIEVSAFMGTGLSRVSIDGVTATASQGGCNYSLNFGVSSVQGTLAELCNASVVVDSFSIPNSTLGIDVQGETQYRARFNQAGMMLQYFAGDWLMRAGYHYQHHYRSQVDDLILSRGGAAFARNHIFAGELMYRLLPNTALFVRGQYMSNQLLGEIPFAYNTLTASRFGKRYGIVSSGLVVVF